MNDPSTNGDKHNTIQSTTTTPPKGMKITSVPAQFYYDIRNGAQPKAPTKFLMNIVPRTNLSKARVTKTLSRTHQTSDHRLT
jgi:hypothetical protein